MTAQEQTDGRPMVGEPATLETERGNVEPAVIEARDVSVRYGGNFVLQSVDFVVERDRMTGLIGPNGAGKTTLLGVLTAIVKPYSGSVWLGGHDASRWSTATRCRRGVARTFQIPQLIEELTAREHILLAERMYASRRSEGPRWLPGVLRAGGSGHTEESFFDQTVELLQLGPFLDHYPSMLPLGVQRIVEVAQCLVMSPSALLLDEPFAGLAAADRPVLESALVRIREELRLALVLVEHDLELVLRNCDVIQVLDHGETLFHGTPAEVVASEAVRRAYIGTT